METVGDKADPEVPAPERIHARNLGERLNEHGELGWELVSCTGLGQADLWFVFKRPSE
jgi:hypothetical protein